ncbi:hypothetical protein BDW71DRAFT_206061 [Aspergillus fruticulosus]
MSSTSIPFYDLSIGLYTKALNVPLRILKRPQAIQTPDRRQTPNATCHSLGRQDVVPWDENATDLNQVALTTWTDVTAHVEKTLELLAQVKPEEVETKAPATKLPIQVGPDADGPHAFRDVSAIESTMASGIPETLFHVYVAYAILRNRGVDVGKKDILIPFLPGDALRALAVAV